MGVVAKHHTAHACLEGEEFRRVYGGKRVTVSHDPPGTWLSRGSSFQFFWLLALIHTTLCRTTTSRFSSPHGGKTPASLYGSSWLPSPSPRMLHKRTIFCRSLRFKVWSHRRLSGHREGSTQRLCPHHGGSRPPLLHCSLDSGEAIPQLSFSEEWVYYSSLFALM